MVREGKTVCTWSGAEIATRANKSIQMSGIWEIVLDLRYVAWVEKRPLIVREQSLVSSVDY